MPNAKLTAALSAPSMGDSLAADHEALTGGPSGIPDPNTLPAAPVDNLTALQHQQEVQRNTSTLDLIGAWYRNDGFIDRGIGHLVGNDSFNPDDSWRPLEDSTYKDLSQGVPEYMLPEFRKSMQDSVSPGHAQYIKDMYLQKANDDDVIANESTAAKVGQFAFDMVSPEQLALGVATMGASKVGAMAEGVMSIANATKAARMASKITDPALRAEQLSKAAEAFGEAAKGGSGIQGTASGIATAAGLGGGFEALRQSANFEDDKSQILDATLFSVAFAAPFIGLGVHQMNRLTASAALERDVLGAMAKMHRGETLSETDLKTMRDYGHYVELIKNDEATLTNPTETHVYDEAKAYNEIKTRMGLQDDFRDRWMERNSEGPQTPPVETGGVPIGEEHIAPPEEPPTKAPPAVEAGKLHWDNQKQPLAEGGYIQVEHTDTGELISGDVMKTSPNRVMLKDENGKLHSIKPEDTTLLSHDPKLQGGGYTLDETTATAPDSPPTIFQDDTHTGTSKGGKERIKRADVVPEGWNPKHDAKIEDGHNHWADRLVDLLKGKKAKQVKAKPILKDLLKRFDGTVYAPIIKALLKSPEIRTKLHLAVDPKAADEGYLGLYWGGPHDVMVTYVNDLAHMTDGEARTFIHELAHAHTVYALEGHMDGDMTAAQKEAVSALHMLHHKAETTLRRTHKVRKGKRGYYEGGFYGLTNVKEFVSELFSNHEFQKMLAEIKMGGKGENVLSSLWKNIKKILGVGRELDDSLFAHAMGYAEQLIGARIQPVAKPDGTFAKFEGGETGGPLARMHNAIPEEPAVPEGPSVMGFVDIGGKQVPIRWDISQTFDNNKNPHIRQLGFDLVKNPIGWKGDKAQGITISERKERIRRVVAGEAHFTMKEALTEALDKRGMGFIQKVSSGFIKQFYEDITKLSRGDETVLHGNRDIEGALRKGAGAIRKFYDTMGKRAMDAGLEGAENLPTHGSYVNRVYLLNKLDEMANLHGEDTVAKLFAESFHNPKIKGDVEVAKGFISAIRAMAYKQNMSDILLNAKDMETLRSTLAGEGLDSHQIEAISNVMFDEKTQQVNNGTKADSGMPTNLKHRMDLDETASITHMGKTLRISDVLENDARLLIDKYTNSMGGHVAMAEHGWTDPNTFFAAKIKEADEWVAQNYTGYDTHKYAADKQLAKDMFDHILGRPMSMQTFGRFDRFMGAMRAYSRSVFLGQLGIAAGFELKNAMAMSAYHGAMSQMPSVARLVDMFRKGIPVEDELAKAIQHIAGFGNEFAMQYGREHEISDHSYGQLTSKFEQFSEKAAHVVDVISGNATFTSATRNLAAKFTVQHMYDMAAGKKSIDAGLMDRLVHNGIDRENIPSTLADLNKYSTADTSGVVKNIDWERWQQEQPKTYDDFSLALERFTRDGIQDHNIGETMPWMHSTAGKIIGELRTFNLVGHAKQFLKNVHYHDRTSAMVFMTGFVGEMLAYGLQTTLNYAHNPDELTRRLTPEMLAKSAVMRMETLGMLSYAIDTPIKAVTGHNYFNGSTANTDNRDMFMTPSMMVMKRMVGAAQTTAQGLSPLSDTLTTKQEVRDGLGILPGINTYGARNVVDFISSHYPKSDPAQYTH